MGSVGIIPRRWAKAPLTLCVLPLSRSLFWLLKRFWDMLATSSTEQLQNITQLHMKSAFSGGVSEEENSRGSWSCVCPAPTIPYLKSERCFASGLILLLMQLEDRRTLKNWILLTAAIICHFSPSSLLSRLLLFGLGLIFNWFLNPVAALEWM